MVLPNRREIPKDQPKDDKVKIEPIVVEGDHFLEFNSENPEDEPKPGRKVVTHPSSAKVDPFLEFDVETPKSGGTGSGGGEPPEEPPEGPKDEPQRPPSRLRRHLTNPHKVYEAVKRAKNIRSIKKAKAEKVQREEDELKKGLERHFASIDKQASLDESVVTDAGSMPHKVPPIVEQVKKDLAAKEAAASRERLDASFEDFDRQVAKQEIEDTKTGDNSAPLTDRQKELLASITKASSEKPAEPAAPELKKEDPKETREGWTEEKEARLQKILGVIEDAKARLAQVDAEIAEIENRIRGKEKAISTNEVPPSQPEQVEVVRFSPDSIEQKIRELLIQNKSIKQVKSVKVEGRGNVIVLNTEVIGKKGPMSVDAGLEVAFVEQDGKLKVKYFNVKAGRMIVGTLERILKPELDKVSERLSDFIQKEQGKKVGKILIEKGQLIVELISDGKN